MCVNIAKKAAAANLRRKKTGSRRIPEPESSELPYPGPAHSGGARRLFAAGRNPEIHRHGIFHPHELAFLLARFPFGRIAEHIVHSPGELVSGGLQDRYVRHRPVLIDNESDDDTSFSALLIHISGIFHIG